VSLLNELDENERAVVRKGRAAFVAPMLATLTKDRFSDPAWIFERKLDGVRTIAVHDGAGAMLWSRNEKPMSSTYPEVVDAVAARVTPGTVLDGEIVAFDGAQTSFERLQGRLGLHDPRAALASGIAVFLYVFDVLVLDGYDVTGLPLRTRKRLLREAVDLGGSLRMSIHRNTEGVAFLQKACERGWEGLVAKRADAPYRPGRRSPDWLKFKCVHGQELVIGGWTDPEGSRSGAPGVHEAAGQRCKPGSGTHSVEYRSPQVTSSGSLLEPHRTPRRDPAGAARAAPCRAQGQVGAVQEQGQVGGDDVIRSRRAQHRPGVRPSEVGVADAVGHLGGVLAAHAARVDTRPAGWILGGLVGGPPGCGPPTTERLAAHAAGAAALRSIHSGGRWCR
jgi:bifunctional non-homologous end joining protein LigD